jgi:cation diffusion facilitator family transporter
LNAPPRYPILLSIAAALITLALKGVAYYITGSVGLLSDALESLINLVAAVTALFALWFAAKPVDPTHTYGHEKIEYFSSGLEGVLILVAAVGISWYAIVRFLSPQPLEEIGWGTSLATAGAIVNFAAAQVLLHVGRKTHSIVLEADGRHLMSDVWTSLGVVIALVLVHVTGWQVLDPIIALLVAAYIVGVAYDLILRSFNGLMDHALPEDEQAKVHAAIRPLLPEGVAYHAVRTRQAGARRFTDFHLLVPGAWSVKKAHDLTGQIEKAIAKALPGIEITVHIEPIEEPAAWQDSELLPVEESKAQK